MKEEIGFYIPTNLLKTYHDYVWSSRHSLMNIWKIGWFQNSSWNQFLKPNKYDKQQVASQLLQWADKEICGGRVKPKNNIAYYKIEEILHCGVTNILVEQVTGGGWGLVFREHCSLNIFKFLLLTYRYIILTTILNM